MGMRLRCRDAGFECDAEVEGETEEEVTRAAEAHVREVHKLPRITPELAARIRPAIRNQ